jgi:hypothetical protein
MANEAERCGAQHPMSDAKCDKLARHVEVGDRTHKGWATTFGGSTCYWEEPRPEDSIGFSYLHLNTKGPATEETKIEEAYETLDKHQIGLDHASIFIALEKDGLTEAEATRTIDAIETISQQDGDGAFLLNDDDVDPEVLAAEAELEAAGPVKVKIE